MFVNFWILSLKFVERRERYLPDLDKVKFLVPQELTLSQLANILRNRLHLTPSQV